MEAIKSSGDIFEIISEMIGTEVSNFEELKNVLEENEEAYEFFYEHLYEIEGIDRVTFDLENTDITGEDFGNPEICGYHSINGLEFIGILAGGDWEVPVFFIVYPSVDRLKAYIPYKGNTYNTISNTAIGSEDNEADMNVFLEKVGITSEEDYFNYKPDAKLIMEDIEDAIDRG